MTYSIFIQTPEGNQLHFRGSEFSDIKVFVGQELGIPEDIQKYHIGGRLLSNISQLSDLCTITLFLGLQGGKGGFGSLLKNQAQTRRKIINWDQSRDRDGRRIINSKNTINLINYFQNKKDEPTKIKKERDQVELTQATLKANESNIKLDQVYIRRNQQNEKNIENSIQQAKGNYKARKQAEKVKEKVELDFLNEIDQFLEDEKLEQQEEQLNNTDEQMNKSESVGTEEPEISKKVKV